MSWEQFSLAPSGSAALPSPIAVVSRIPGSMELWWVAPNGSVQGAYWYSGANWERYQLAPPGSAAVHGGIAAVSRIPTSMELWYIGQDGSVQDHYWYQGGSWESFELAPAGSASTNGGIAAVSRIPTSMEVWYVGATGSLQDHYWYAGRNWESFQLAPPGSAVSVAAVSRIPTSMELWCVQADGSVEDHYWHQGGNWETFELAPAGSASANGGIAAVSRIPTSMEVWYIGRDGSVQDHYWYQGGSWQSFELAPAEAAAMTSGIAAVSRIPTSMELWYVAQDGSLQDHYWYQGSNWQTFQLANPGSATLTSSIAAVSRIPTSMELWHIAEDGSVMDDYWYAAPVPAPGAGLGGNSNYLLYSGCDNMVGVEVTVEVTEDIVGSNGFGFQVNAYSAKGDYDGAQQYLIYIAPNSTELVAMVDNWYTTSVQVANQQVALATLPSSVLPTGYRLTIALNNDGSGNITGATYNVTDANGNVIGGQTITLLSLGGVTQADLAPIVAFQFDIVGYLNGTTTTLSSGAGKIIYSAAMPLTALSSEPACVDWDYGTVENANSVYGVLTANPSTILDQSFGTSTGALISNQASVQHVTKAI